jgi:hypothetical protein
MAQNYKFGEYRAPGWWRHQRVKRTGAPAGANAYSPLFSVWGGASSYSGVNAYTGSDLIGAVDWNNLENVQAHSAGLRGLNKVQASKSAYWNKRKARDWADWNDNKARRDRGEDVGELRVPAHTDVPEGANLQGDWSLNPFHSQGLGPKRVKSLRELENLRTQFWQAQQVKFDNRIDVLKGVEAAGGWDAYNQQAADRAELAISRPDAARASELLRSETGGSPRARTPGGASLGQGRHARYASRNERQRNPVRRPSGSVSRKRLRAASMLGQPLGGGSQSAAQLLG